MADSPDWADGRNRRSQGHGRGRQARVASRAVRAHAGATRIRRWSVEARQPATARAGVMSKCFLPGTDSTPLSGKVYKTYYVVASKRSRCFTRRLIPVLE